MNNVRLSILILSITERIGRLSALIKIIERQRKRVGQSFNDGVEVIVDMDNRTRSIAAKRNNLINQSQGDFLCFIDDDDEIDKDYLLSIVESIDNHPDADCISFNQSCVVDGRKFSVQFGLGNPITSEVLNSESGRSIIKRPPYHICAFRSTIAKKVMFRDITANNNYSVEDIDWLIRLYPLLNTEYHIDKTLHYYNFNTHNSRSRG